VVIFTLILSSPKTDFVWKTYCVFGVGGFTGLYLKRGQNFLHLILPPLLDYDVFMDEVVELVVVIPTSPRSSKMEFGYKSYRRFLYCLLFLAGLSGPNLDRIIREGGTIQPKMEISSQIIRPKSGRRAQSP
jgi:hypothetical protein